MTVEVSIRHHVIGTWSAYAPNGVEVAFTISARAMASKLAHGRDRFVDLSKIARGTSLRVRVPPHHPILDACQASVHRSYGLS